MVYGIGFTHEFSHTRQTILRSKPIQLSPLVHSTDIVYKSTTSNHPKQWRLPMSLVYNKKSDIWKLGHLNDFKARLSGARTYLLSVITLAIEFIYEQGHNLVSTAVKHLLSASLLVPTKVL